jgi:hypothetical protein
MKGGMVLKMLNGVHKIKGSPWQLKYLANWSSVTARRVKQLAGL